MKEQSASQAVQTDSEFSRCAVPESERKSYVSLTIIWTGFIFAIISLMAGGTLALGLSFQEIILVSLVGNVFLCAIAIAVSVIASRTGLTFALLTRYSFGSSGSKVASLFVPIVNVGWYTIQSASYGHFVASVFQFGEIGEAICMIVSAALMGIFAFYGVKAITILGYVAIPAIIFLTVATTIRSVGVMGSMEALLGYRPSAPISLAAGITVVIGAWILSTATCLPDIMRYAKSTKTAIAASLTGLLGGNILMLICGAIATIAMNEYDLTVILLGFGLVVPSLILMTTNIFTTNAANLYSTSLNLANSFQIGRTKMMLILIGISSLATLLKPHEADFYYTFLNALGNVIPPLAGIILADYFIVNRGRYAPLDQSKFTAWNPIPWISWGISVAIVFALTAWAPGVIENIPAPFTGIVLGALFHTILMKATKTKVNLSEEEHAA
ncbi:MAG: allantoin permease [Oscillospiraceae bacterium]|nr:allantoin permease [Oscillospiraceae bacterium]